MTEIVDDQGEVIERCRYSPYGKLGIYDSSWNALTASAIGNPYFFTGREYDPESGLYYYRARMYSPVLGRFLQIDPVMYLDGFNLYQYVANSPTNYIDPTGEAWGPAHFIGSLTGDILSGRNVMESLELAVANVLTDFGETGNMHEYHATGPVGSLKQNNLNDSLKRVQQLLEVSPPSQKNLGNIRHIREDARSIMHGGKVYDENNKFMVFFHASVEIFMLPADTISIGICTFADNIGW